MTSSRAREGDAHSSRGARRGEEYMSRAATQSAREKCCSVGMSEEEKERDEFVYCLEACPLKKSQLNAVDFALNCAFRKIFSTRSQDCLLYTSDAADE